MSEATSTTPAANLGTPPGDTVVKKYVSTADLAAGLDDADFDPAPSGDPQELLDLANGTATKPKKAKPTPPPSLDDSEDDEEEAEYDAAPEADDDEAEEEDELLPKGKGSKENPLSVKELPTDKFVTVKVDGKEEVVDLRDAVNGYIRTQTFDRLTSKVKAAETEALEIARSAVQERQQFREGVEQWFKDPSKVFERLDEHYPDTLLEVGRMLGQRLKHEMENPGAREQRELDKERQRLARERQEILREREEHERTQQEKQAAAARQAALKPGYDAGMKAAGFPKITPDLQRAIRAFTIVARDANGGQLTADDVKQAVIDAAAYVKSRGGQVEAVQERRPAPAPIPTPKAKRPASNGKKSWEGVPISQRLRDPNFW